MDRHRGWIALGIWAIILLAFYLAATIVPLPDDERCERAGGEWYEPWSRCYGD